MADNTRSRSVCLGCSDSKDVLIDEPFAKQVPYVKQIIEERHPPINNNAIFIQLPFVTSTILTKVLNYCAKHAKHAAAASASTTTTTAATATTATTTTAAAGEGSGGGTAAELRRWDEEFMRSLESEPDTLLDMVVAAANLDVQSLIDLLCKELPEVPEDKPPE